MLYENDHELDCGVLGKLEAQISFDFDDTHIFNESVFFHHLMYRCDTRTAKVIITEAMEEIRGTKEYREALTLLTTKE